MQDVAGLIISQCLFGKLFLASCLSVVFANSVCIQKKCLLLCEIKGTDKNKRKR
jgi:hypothetical protein